MAGFTGDVDQGQVGGPLLSQIPLPQGFATKKYVDLVSYLILKRGLVPLGLYRRKHENPAWILRYVVINPSPSTALVADDLVYVVKEPVSNEESTTE